MNVVEMFAHVSEADKALAVEGFALVNPGYRGIDFYTMMDILIDADAYLPILGDVDLNQPVEATRFVQHFIDITTKKSN